MHRRPQLLHVWMSIALAIIVSGCPIGRPYEPTIVTWLQPTSEETYRRAASDGLLPPAVCAKECRAVPPNVGPCHVATLEMTPGSAPGRRILTWKNRTPDIESGRGGTHYLSDDSEVAGQDPAHVDPAICQKHTSPHVDIAECTVTPPLGPAPPPGTRFIECNRHDPDGIDIPPR